MPFRNETQIKNAIVRKLGGGVVDIELTTSQLDDVMETTKRWFRAKKGLIYQRVIPFSSNRAEYIMDPDVENVIDVSLDLAPDLIAFFSIGFFDVLPFGFPFAFPTTPSTLQYSGYVQLLQFNEIRKRIFSIEPTWTYEQQTRSLIIAPTPVRSGQMLIRYKSFEIDVRQLFARDEQIFWEYALAQAKMTLGSIRRKYSEYPTAGGGTSMDGPELISDARDTLERLEQEISKSQGPIPFVIG